MLQNATLLRKSAPGPPNSSDEHVSCTALPREMHLPYPLHMSHTCHQFWNCYKTLTFCSLLTRCPIPSRCHANDTWTSKSAPYPSVFCTFDLEMCFAPQRRALFRHLNFQKWSEHEVVCTCLLGNVLRATTARTFSTSQLLNVLGSWSVLYILTWNVLRTTTACNFSSLIWPHRSAPAALASLLVDPPEPQIIGKTQCFATFLPFRAPGSFFFGDFLFLISFFFSSLLWLFPSLLFICPYCRKFDFQTSFDHQFIRSNSKLPNMFHQFLDTRLWKPLKNRNLL